LMPPKPVILDRLSKRGDEFQDASSVIKLYDLFDDEVRKIQDLPNVLVIRTESDVDSLASLVLKNVGIYENFTPSLVGSLMRMWTKISENSEIQFKINLNVATTHDDSQILHNEHEGEYFIDILNKCNSVIQDEIAGKNPYNLPQDLSSRRFFYSSDTCISSIHFLVRDESLKVIATLRSTDAVVNGSLDLRFLAHLAADVARSQNWNLKKIDLHVRYNSLHIRLDKI